MLDCGAVCILITLVILRLLLAPHIEEEIRSYPCGVVGCCPAELRSTFGAFEQVEKIYGGMECRRQDSLTTLDTIHNRFNLLYEII